MNYLNQQHQELAENQQSGLMSQFAQLRFDQRMVAIAASSALALTCSALAWTGASSSRVYFCLVSPTQDLQCYDKQNRPFRMTRHHWEAWKEAGMPNHIIPNAKVGNDQGLVPATNPYKAAWAFGAFIGFAAAGWMLRHLQFEESKLAPLEATAQKRDEAIAELSARGDVLAAAREPALRQAELEADVELARYEHQMLMGHAELLGATELEIAQLEAEEAKFEAQTAGFTEEQKAEYVEFLRNVQTPYLMPGQTIAGIADPSDKVATTQQQAIGGEQQQEKPQPVPTDELEFDITRLNPPHPTQGKNIAIVAGQGVGKTTLALYIAGEILQSPDIQVYDLDDDGKTWGNLPVWGTGDDETEVAGAMQADAELFKERTQQRIDGDRFPFAVRILDETPATYQRIKKPFKEWSFMMTSRARKRAMIALLLTQFREPDLNGIEPDQWRTSFATLYLGFKQTSHALNYLVKPKDLADRLRAKLGQCQRPCLVAFEDGWYWFDVPDLEQWKQEFLAKTHGKINPTSDTQLELKPETQTPPEPPKEAVAEDDRIDWDAVIAEPEEEATPSPKPQPEVKTPPVPLNPVQLDVLRWLSSFGDRAINPDEAFNSWAQTSLNRKGFDRVIGTLFNAGAIRFEDGWIRVIAMLQEDLIDSEPEKEESSFSVVEIKVHNAAIEFEEGATAREIAMKKLAEFSAMSYSDSVEAIQAIFLTLESKGAGSVFQGRTMRYVPEMGVLTS
ncbi:hypothetical protein IFO70_33265 [Phormidium tenue FACHB-886]|nr:hypothetical protein [Phormidium tenue FACHB-886]